MTGTSCTVTRPRLGPAGALVDNLGVDTAGITATGVAVATILLAVARIVSAWRGDRFTGSG